MLAAPSNVYVAKTKLMLDLNWNYKYLIVSLKGLAKSLVELADP